MCYVPLFLKLKHFTFIVQFTIVICNFFFHFTPFQVVYKIIDLGYAKQLDQESLATTFVGTLKYVVGICYFYKLFLLVTEQVSFTWIYGPLLSMQMDKSAIYMPF